MVWIYSAILSDRAGRSRLPGDQTNKQVKWLGAGAIPPSAWPNPLAGELPADLHVRLGIAMSHRTSGAYRALLHSDRWQRLLNKGARPQRLLWASTGTKDRSASDVL